MDAEESKEVNVSSHIENAEKPPTQSGTLIVSTIPPHRLSSLLWLVLGLD